MRQNDQSRGFGSLGHLVNGDGARLRTFGAEGQRDVPLLVALPQEEGELYVNHRRSAARATQAARNLFGLIVEEGFNGAVKLSVRGRNSVLVLHEKIPRLYDNTRAGSRTCLPASAQTRVLRRT